MPHFDVVIIGAGFSGIAAAYHLQKRCPHLSYVILEARDDLGGTWDLFRYPGIRSDSDMYTFGFSFRPWTGTSVVAKGEEIKEYLRQTAREFGIDRNFRFRHKVESLNWSDSSKHWTLDVIDQHSNSTAVTAGFVLTCTGYYDYSAGHNPEIANRQAFNGSIIHPQFWPDNLDYSAKKIVVIGSGATAVTIVPAMAREAGHVTMLQRSPSFVAGRPARDELPVRLRKFLPQSWVHRIMRWRNILTHLYLYGLARRKPDMVRTALVDMAANAVGPECDAKTHFNPRYNPWDQRLCFVPDNDLFDAIRIGKASVVTGDIEMFTPSGLALISGEQIEADIVVMATGLSLQLMGDIPITVNGQTVNPAATTTYKGLMYAGIPNLASIFGYTNAPFTMRADPSMKVITRILTTMKRDGWRRCLPVAEGERSEQPFIDLESGYVARSVDKFPKQGIKDPWRIRQNYLRDRFALEWQRVGKGLEFTS